MTFEFETGELIDWTRGGRDEDRGYSANKMPQKSSFYSLNEIKFSKEKTLHNLYFTQ